MNITRVKQASPEFIKVLRYGKSDIQTADPILPHGIDSKPVKNDIAVYAKTNNNEQSVILGYLKNSDITSEGEARIYATDQNGVLKFDIRLKNDGTAEIGGDSDFMVRFSVLETAYNQLKSDHDDTVSKLNAVIDLLKTWTVIAQDGGAALQLAAQALQNASNSTGDISGAKIDEIKTL